MAKKSKEVTEGKPVWIPSGDVKMIQAERERLSKERLVQFTEGDVAVYWLRLGMKTEPQIKGVIA